MTQIWRGDKVMAVTRVQAGPCPIIQIKSKENDGYAAVQIGHGEKKEKNIKKPQKGHLKKLITRNPQLTTNIKFLREFRCSADEISKLGVGDIVDVTTFEPGDKIEAEGVSKGKGFQGVVKRHGFHGQDKTHGNKDQLRMPGSIGAQAMQRVHKGKRMAGRMGGAQITTKNLEIADIDKENNILLIKGAVPGAKNGLVLIAGKGELKVKPADASSFVEATAGKKSLADKAVEHKKEISEEKDAEEKKEEIKEDQKEKSAAKPKEEAAVAQMEKKKTEPVSVEPSKSVIAPEATAVKKVDDYLQKFNRLDEEMRRRISKPAAIEVVNKMEEKYEVDLVEIILQVATKEIKKSELRNYFKNVMNLDTEKAEKLEEELKENIFPLLKD